MHVRLIIYPVLKFLKTKHQRLLLATKISNDLDLRSFDKGQGHLKITCHYIFF